MGLFDFNKKKEFILENKENAKITKLKSIDTNFSKERDDFINTYSNVEENRLYCDQNLFWNNAIDIVSKDININIGNYICSELYNTIVINKNNENLIRKFEYFKNLFLDKSLLEKINYKKLIEDFNNIYTMFNDKEAAKEIIKILYKKDDSNQLIYGSVLRDELKNFIIETRKYFNDEGAYISLILDTISKIDLQAFNIETVKDILKEATIFSRQLAGFYELDEVEIAKLPEKVKRMTEDMKNRYDHLVNTFSNREGALEREVSEAVESFKKETKGILGEADETIAKINSVADNRQRQLEGLGKTINLKIQNFLGQHPEAEEVLRAKDSGYNELLDMNIPARTRYATAIQYKDNTKLYHERFDDCLKFTINNEPILLQGPSGCGKSTIARQVCEVLNLKFVNIGYIADEFVSIRGFMDANGNYSPVPFYDCYKYGYACFLDEIDNSEPKALLELNKITGTDGFLPYVFPNGEEVKPHPNFRLFAAANTFGEGGNASYQRNPLDASSIDRYSVVKIDYDENLEKKIMKNHLDVYEFLIAFRDITNNMGNKNLIVTTKTMASINKGLESTIVSLDEALRAKLIKGEDPQTLDSICSEIIDKTGDTECTRAFQKAINNDRKYRR